MGITPKLAESDAENLKYYIQLSKADGKDAQAAEALFSITTGTDVQPAAPAPAHSGTGSPAEQTSTPPGQGAPPVLLPSSEKAKEAGAEPTASQPATPLPPVPRPETRPKTAPAASPLAAKASATKPGKK